MKKKKIFLITVVFLILLLIGGGLFYYFVVQDKDSTLTIAEKQWIEENKNNIIDLSMPTDIPVFSYEGKGVLFDFVDNIEKATGLEFNKLSYSLDNNPTSAYSFLKVDKKDKEDLLIYQDNYVILTKDNKKYNNLKDLPIMTLGVLDINQEKTSTYLKENTGLTYQTYKDLVSMQNALKLNKVQGIILPKTLYIDDIISNNELNIAYNISEMTEDLVIRLGDNKKLNTIIKKYFKKWKKEKYTEIFNTYFSDNYFNFKQIYENQKVQFKSKRYSYGFVSNAPFDDLKNGSLIGINSEIIKSFSKVADIEVSFNQYKDISSMLNAFNDKKIDFFLNQSSTSEFNNDAYETIEVSNDPVVVISNINNNITVNSVSSLISKKVSVIADSKIYSYLSNYDISLDTYSNLNAIFDKLNKDSIIVIDKKTYDAYSKNTLKDYKADYEFYLNNGYSYVLNKTEENNIFTEFFDFYNSFINQNYYANKVNYKDFNSESISLTTIYIAISIFIFGLVGVVILLSRKTLIGKKKVKKVSKEDKLKYIDQMTCLKNRNFLNDSISKWDESDIYPQCIVIVDLNNIAYINDNYGHQEGDKVIVEASNVLINTQLENSEIIRTDGNEFLVYLVAYDEKQIVSYIRKLHKELREISHGFGAAMGYSMINDGIKTIDDAINEATLDMKSNKEEVQG